MTELRIDPEFKNKIPPLTESEFQQLEENIVSDGEVYEPIKVWNGVIIDGHNRWEIIKKHPEIPYKIKEMDFADKWSAFDWMYKNQLGRRNLTDEQKTYLLGKMYEARKHSYGAEKGGRGNQYYVVSDQSDHLPHGRIKEQIAKEQKVGQGTVQRAEDFAHGIDAIRETEPELADSILTAETKATQQAIMEIGKSKPEERQELIQSVKDGKCKQRKGKIEVITEAAEEMFETPKPIEYGIQSFIQDIETNSAPFIRLLRQMVTANKEICISNKAEVIKEIHNSTIAKIEEIEKEIEGYE